MVRAFGGSLHLQEQPSFHSGERNPTEDIAGRRIRERGDSLPQELPQELLMELPFDARPVMYIRGHLATLALRS